MPWGKYNMRLDEQHVRFYQDKKAGRPGWSQISTRTQPVSIHYLINLQVVDPWMRDERDPQFVKRNAIGLFRLARRHAKSDLAVVQRYAFEAEDKARRDVFHRWLRHIERAEASTWLVVILDNREECELARYPLKRHDTTDMRHWANEWAEALGWEIDDSDGHIPRGSGDITVEVYDTSRHTVGGVVAWSREDFYLKKE